LSTQRGGKLFRHRIDIDDRRLGAFPRKRFDDRPPDSFGAADNQSDVVLLLKVHARKRSF
jgi:hypothetical protein